MKVNMSDDITISFRNLLEIASTCKTMWSKDGKVFYDSYEDLEKDLKGDILLPSSLLEEERKYYVIKSK